MVLSKNEVSETETRSTEKIINISIFAIKKGNLWELCILPINITIYTDLLKVYIEHDWLVDDPYLLYNERNHLKVWEC